MGQCMSRKASAFADSAAAAAHNRPLKMKKHGRFQSPEEDTNKDLAKKQPINSKGVATSFGFKRRSIPTTLISANSNTARRLANTDKDTNGNGNDTDSLTSNAIPIGRSTIRLMPPKKEGSTTRVNRFGFRQPQINRLNKVADLNNPPQLCNINADRPRTTPLVSQNKASTDNNRNRVGKQAAPTLQTERCTLQYTQLPRPETIRLIETKVAKTLANNSRKIANTYHHEDTSSKDGYFTEDSGVSVHNSDVREGETIPGVERLNSSPTFNTRRSYHKSRNLEVVRTGNGFDVCDLDDTTENSAVLPQLPSAFRNSPRNLRNSYHNTGFVREMAMEYQRHLVSDSRRKISTTSSEGFSDDYKDEEKLYKDKYKSEKLFIKSTPHKTFLKSSCNLKDNSSPQSSDEHDWFHGGEAMADEVSCSFSSSDESKDKDQFPVIQPSPKPTSRNLFSSNAFHEIKNVSLTIEDSKFDAIAAASNATLLDDETSPVDSLIISCSESDEILKRKLNRSPSDSKDINEKLTPPSPGTPTNASNSLSLSDGKDDFLIDDEIADQPALVFEDALLVGGGAESYSISQNTSEGTATIVDSTPKVRRRNLGASFDGSPLLVRRNAKFGNNRTGSLDTLSPCESIASDDLMMDYDYSQSSGVEDGDRGDGQNHGFASLNDGLRPEFSSKRDVSRDWTVLLGNYLTDKPSKCTLTRGARLTWSQTDTPNSIPNSPKSLDSKATSSKSRPSLTNSPIRLSRASHTGYDSDDSIRLDRTNHTAMKQDIISMKTMLVKLRRVLNESETHIPFDGQSTLTNGLFNGLCSNDSQIDDADNRLELAELRRQVIFLQDQLEEREHTVQTLQEQMVKLATENYNSNSAPASTSAVSEGSTCNAATQTDRIRPISAGPSLTNGTAVETNNAGSLVSASESVQHRRPRPLTQKESRPHAKKPVTRLWRKPGEPPSPHRSINSSSIPRRAYSQTRPPSTLS